MINLLPPQEKKALTLIIREKLVVILGSVALIALVCLILVLLSLRFYILANDLYYREFLQDIQKRYEFAHDDSIKDDIKKYNAELVVANAFYKNQNYVSDSVARLLEIRRPRGLYFTSISVDNSLSAKYVKLTVSGVSPTRDGLLSFKEALTSSTYIKNVYFPPEAWVKPTDVTFYVTMEINEL